MTLAARAAHARLVPEAPATEAKTEFGIVPIAGGNTDYGLGGGFLTNVARLDPGVSPYAWRLEAAAFITFKAKDAAPSEWVNPYQDYYFLLTVPHFLHERLRLELRPSYTRETTQLYYGLGNASVAPPDEIPGRDFYGRAHPTLSDPAALGPRGRRLRRARRRLHRELVRARSAEHARHRHEHGRARRARAAGHGHPPRRAARRERADLRHARLRDRARSRASTTSSRSATARRSATTCRTSTVRPTRRCASTVPFTERLGLAIRAVGDWQFGDVPFYELARYEDTFAFGGVNGVRGIPGQRYYGRIKLFSNVELRSRLLDFTWFRKPYALGGALFTDFGRLWTDFASHPELDGSGLGLKYGVGGGVRLQQGKTFVIRVDVAWSPDARPIGAYLTAGHAF